jgi:hypothetical protein
MARALPKGRSVQTSSVAVANVLEELLFMSSPPEQAWARNGNLEPRLTG